MEHQSHTDLLGKRAPMVIEFYSTKSWRGKVKWRWRIIARNGNNLANSSTFGGYSRLIDAVAAVEAVTGTIAPIDVLQYPEERAFIGPGRHITYRVKTKGE